MYSSSLRMKKREREGERKREGGRERESREWREVWSETNEFE
jgi:hypothetical protein